jgi:hypothetical protein
LFQPVRRNPVVKFVATMTASTTRPMIAAIIDFDIKKRTRK